MTARRIARHGVRVLSWAWTVIVVLALAGLTTVWILGLQLRSIDSGSMAPTVPQGSLAVMESVPEQDLAVGDVVEFTDPADTTRTVLHRIVEITSSRGAGRYLRTQGDANATPDPLLVPASAVHARLTHSTPGAGAVFWALRPPAGVVILAGGPLAMLLVSTFVQRQGPAGGSHQSEVPAASSGPPTAMGLSDDQPLFAG